MKPQFTTTASCDTRSPSSALSTPSSIATVLSKPEVLGDLTIKVPCAPIAHSSTITSGDSNEISEHLRAAAPRLLVLVEANNLIGNAICMLVPTSTAVRIVPTPSKVGDLACDCFDEDLGKSASETGFGIRSPDHFSANLAALWSIARTCLTPETTPSPLSARGRKKASGSNTPIFAIGA